MLYDVCLWFPCVYIITHKWEQVNRQDNIFTLICEYMGQKKSRCQKAQQRPLSGHAAGAVGEGCKEVQFLCP